jgi:two-component system, NarL family, sensor histidine kinase UhpB
MAQAIVTDALFRPALAPQPMWEGHAAHIARELHDGVAGELSTMLLDLERFRAEQTGRRGVLAEIEQMQEQVRFVLTNVRRLLYDQRGLPGIEPDFAGSLSRGLVRRFADRTGIRVHLSVGRAWPSVLPADTALHLRWIVQEALNNVDRHSGASAVLIRLDIPAGGTAGRVTISDDGHGNPELGVNVGFGLLGIQERALLLGAKVTVRNRRRGGSALAVTLPRRSLGL